MEKVATGDGADEILDALCDIGFEDRRHSGHTLTRHLKNTYLILKDWGLEEHVCVGGLCHSIYGTQTFRHQTLPFDRRDAVREILGKDAEWLAYLFCVHDKKLIWENLDRDPEHHRVIHRIESEVIPITRQTFLDLLNIILANWVELKDRTGKQHPKSRTRLFLRTRGLVPDVVFREVLVSLSSIT